MPTLEPDFYNSVWAEEGGVMVSIHRSSHGHSEVQIEIYEDVQDKKRKPIVATLANYRWERLVEWLDKERKAQSTTTSEQQHEHS